MSVSTWVYVQVLLSRWCFSIVTLLHSSIQCSLGSKGNCYIQALPLWNFMSSMCHYFVMPTNHDATCVPACRNAKDARKRSSGVGMFAWFEIQLCSYSPLTKMNHASHSY
jgi:hypothetical protein